jgi:hypothetical protein
MLMFMLDPLGKFGSKKVPKHYALVTMKPLVAYHITTDNSTNNWIFAVVYWGEGWHNNHHANPKKWNFGERWWEIDVSGCIIRLVQKKLT